MVLLQEQTDDARWSDVEFLKTANEQLVECRRVLKYTYVYAYYLTATDKQAMRKERFEHHQEMLERFTENLSELSEKPLAEMDRTDVVNQVIYFRCQPVVVVVVACSLELTIKLFFDSLDTCRRPIHEEHLEIC